jgi:hypothetical protein
MLTASFSAVTMSGGGKAYAAGKYLNYNGFEYYTTSAGAYIVGYTGKNAAIAIPEKINGKFVVYLELCGFRGTSVDFRKCTQLKSLHAEMLAIRTIDLSGNTQLTSLALHETYNVTKIDLSRNLELTNCYIDGRSIDSVNLRNNLKLKSCFISSGKISSVDLSRNTKLETLCINAPITSLNIVNSPILTELTVNGGRLTALNVSRNTALKKLDVSNNALKTLDTSKNSKLTSLNCAYNAGLSMNIANNKSLTVFTYSPDRKGSKTINNPHKSAPGKYAYKNA